MALQKNQLKAALIEAFSNPTTEGNINEVAEKIANAINEFVKSGTVIGTCPSGGGPLTAGKVE